jgi:hypothetical protein
MKENLRLHGTFLGDQPTSLEAAILLGGVREILGKLVDGVPIWEAMDRQLQDQLRQQIQERIEWLAKPLLGKEVQKTSPVDATHAKARLDPRKP